MKILVDENMPYATQLFQTMGEVKAVSGRSISSSELATADALMVRSVTQVNEALLKESKVKFVGTATAGFDHVDRQWLAQAGIVFSAAPGCNATAVVEYVFSALLVLAERDCFDLREKTVGIVGVGNVGSRLNARLKAWGVNTLLCDPPRADAADNIEQFWPLEKLVSQADILTFHTPLNKSGRYSSYHLLNEELLAAMPAGRILLNTSRGSVVDNQALLTALENGKKIDVILDVWQHEPSISLPLLAKARIGTPHIAGYSLEGKARGTSQIFTAFSQFLGQEQQIKLADLLPSAEFNEITFSGELTQASLKRLVHLVYDVRRDDAPLRKIAHLAGQFDHLRKYYPERREWSSLRVSCNDVDAANALKMIGFNTKLI
ncbi:4-phosphoerythronate dehydrogenase PdxB [Arsenophonus endosymbiont of Aphis craccivora]|uniref:4-phosphoerythronate dehydrogenase PdxB n=1 Tax=Arsenophonus endosymbiont of Aphis craccivora TaxID=1231049 RepID=UPI0015DBF92A|nr:4-phosphoerythronate dehydrogenase PdxB [Arsenophonus endosymbiont of Aphis craccivora]QLK88067.1 4-phosphoerythronate dehydrogenase PdxB [Arsenophonus endosymbiont of Aphis craccivora]